MYFGLQICIMLKIYITIKCILFINIIFIFKNGAAYEQSPTGPQTVLGFRPRTAVAYVSSIFDTYLSIGILQVLRK